jgi:Tfp pilus assembly protein PilV
MTLIEVMISLLVAVVGLLGSLAMVSSVMNATAFSRRASEATVLAQARLEELQSLTGVTAVVGAGNPLDTAFVAETAGVNGAIANPLDSTGHTNANPSFGLYTRMVSWGTVTDTAGLRRSISVQVSWTETDGRTHQVVVSGVRIP